MNGYLIALNILLCILSIVAGVVSINLAQSASLTGALLRNTRVESQRVQQSIKILEAADYQESIANLDSGLNDLKISIAEFMSDNHEHSGAFDVSYELDKRDEELLSQSLFSMRLFRMNLKFKADRAIAIADFLQATKKTMAPWPTEVRACDIHRFIANQLLVHCVLDIHYWGPNE